MTTGLFGVPTDVVTGLGSLERLPELLGGLGTESIAVAVDSGLADNGVLDFVLGHAPGFRPAIVSRFPANPDVAAVETAAVEARAAGAEAVLGIGGGSALGGAKALAIRLTNDQPITAYEGSGRVPHLPAPSVAVPTTAGSGSEVSNALVLHEAGRPTELVVRGRGCEPRVAVLDGRVLRGLPGPPMLFAGLDALTHAMEALWARGRTFFTTAMALHAAQRIVELLPVALEGVASGRNRSGGNDEVLQELLEASSAANMACGNSGLGLVHALSSSPAIGLAHGLQNGVLLPHVAAFNSDVLPPEGRELLPRIDALYERVRFEASFPAVTDGAVQATAMVAATEGHPFRRNNLRSSDDADLMDIVVRAGADRAVGELV
jgi:alcohol dehydrogenase class IV